MYKDIFKQLFHMILTIFLLCFHSLHKKVYLFSLFYRMKTSLLFDLQLVNHLIGNIDKIICRSGTKILIAKNMFHSLLKPHIFPFPLQELMFDHENQGNAPFAKSTSGSKIFLIINKRSVVIIRKISVDNLNKIKHLIVSILLKISFN